MLTSQRCIYSMLSVWLYLFFFWLPGKSSADLRPERSDRSQIGCWLCLFPAPLSAPTVRQDALSNTTRFRPIRVTFSLSTFTTHWVNRCRASLTRTDLILAIEPGLFVIDGEEQHISELQICKKWKAQIFNVRHSEQVEVSHVTSSCIVCFLIERSLWCDELLQHHVRLLQPKDELVSASFASYQCQGATLDACRHPVVSRAV